MYIEIAADDPKGLGTLAKFLGEGDPAEGDQPEAILCEDRLREVVAKIAAICELTQPKPGPQLWAIAYTVAFGPIPAGLVATVTCGNDYCINPNHLALLPPT